MGWIPAASTVPACEGPTVTVCQREAVTVAIRSPASPRAARVFVWCVCARAARGVCICESKCMRAGARMIVARASGARLIV